LVFLVVVSESRGLMIAYVLDKEITGEKILQDINGLINKFKQTNPQNIPILTISIKTISHEDTSLIPKLEHKVCST